MSGYWLLATGHWLGKELRCRQRLRLSRGRDLAVWLRGISVPEVAGPVQVPSGAIDIPSMSDPHHHDPQDVILDLVQDPVVALADPVPLLPRELFCARWTRVLRKVLDPGHNAPPVFRGHLPKLLRRRPFDLETIACHAASSP